MRKINYKLKALCIEFCGSQLYAATRARINPTRLSLIINKHTQPTATELAALTELFGAKALRACDLRPSNHDVTAGDNRAGGEK